MQFQLDPDWWIYVPLYALGAALCVIQLPKSGIWRLLSAIVIVLGGLHVAFIAWSIRHASRAVLTERFYEVCGRLIFYHFAYAIPATGEMLL